MSAPLRCGFLFVLLAFCARTAHAEPIRVVPQSGVASPRQPQAAVDAEGVIYIAFGAGDTLYCVRSTDQARTFSRPARVDKVAGLALGLRRGPRIVARPEAIVVSAISHSTGELTSWRSVDGAKTWEGPFRINDRAQSAREGLHAMAISAEGDLCCTWLDLRSAGTEIYAAVSSDGGRSWSQNRRVYRSPSGSVCECCHPAVAYDPVGGLHIMWRNSLNGARDLYAAESRDGGQSFGKAVKLGSASWTLDACPMDGGGIAATGAGKFTSVWQRDRQVFRTRSQQREEALVGPGVQPWVATTRDGLYIVWLSQRPGDLWLSTPMEQPARLASNATDPMLAAPVGGTGPVVAVWESGQTPDTAIMAAIVSH